MSRFSERFIGASSEKLVDDPAMPILPFDRAWRYAALWHTRGKLLGDAAGALPLYRRSLDTGRPMFDDQRRPLYRDGWRQDPKDEDRRAPATLDMGGDPIGNCPASKAGPARAVDDPAP